MARCHALSPPPSSPLPFGSPLLLLVPLPSLSMHSNRLAYQYQYCFCMRGAGLSVLHNLQYMVPPPPSSLWFLHPPPPPSPSGSSLLPLPIVPASSLWFLPPPPFLLLPPPSPSASSYNVFNSKAYQNNSSMWAEGGRGDKAVLACPLCRERWGGGGGAHQRQFLHPLKSILVLKL